MLNIFQSEGTFLRVYLCMGGLNVSTWSQAVGQRGMCAWGCSNWRDECMTTVWVCRSVSAVTVNVLGSPVSSIRILGSEYCEGCKLGLGTGEIKKVWELVTRGSREAMVNNPGRLPGVHPAALKMRRSLTNDR